MKQTGTLTRGPAVQTGVLKTEHTVVAAESTLLTDFDGEQLVDFDNTELADFS